MLKRTLSAAGRYYCLQLSREAHKGVKLPVILSQDVPKLGSSGNRVEVEPGFAHNWLLPQKLAVYDIAARHGSRKRKTKEGSKQESVEKLAAEEQKRLEKIVRKLLGSPLVVKRKFRKGEILEGQVTAGSVVDAIAKQKRIDVARELVELPAPILTHGSFDVPMGIFLPSGEKAMLKVVVSE